MSVHYKFKSALDFDTITFDGLHISVNELKKAIISQKRLGKNTDFDLKITNAQTKEDYDDDSYLIPKNTSLIIARIPLATVPKKIWEQQFKQEHQAKGFQKVDKVVLDIFKMVGSEEEKIQAMMQQSAADYDPKGYQKVKGQPQIGEVPANYRCNKCKKVGHWIKNCPYTTKDHIEMKRTTGIPKSFREKDDRPCEPTVAELATARNGKIPDNLICSICNDIFTDAVMIPCCGSSFCDDCVRTSLLESDDNECPDCKEKGSSPGSLIPNRFLRNSVNAFKNETGYKRPAKKTEVQSSEELPLPEKTAKTEQISSIVEDQENVESTSAQQKNTVEVNPSTQSNESTSADESDYEDNITVTVPSKGSIENNSTIQQKKSFDEGNIRSTKNSDKSPQPLTQATASTYDEYQAKFSHFSSGNWDGYSKKDENEESQTKKRKLLKPLFQSSSTSLQNTTCRETQFPLIRQEQLYQPIPSHTFTPHQTVSQGLPMGYTQMSTAHNYSHYPQLPYTSRMGCMPVESSETPQLSANLASVYQGVAAKVGSGVIDDPLEAFNRIMREKEKKKEHQRSPHRRSPRSKEENFRKYSPQHLKQHSRGPVSPYKTNPVQKIFHRQSREREKFFYRNQGPESNRSYQKRSSSLSDRSSRTHQQGNYSRKDRHENEDFHKNNLSDICPPGTSERPPPGFENSSHKRENRKNKHCSRDDYNKNRYYGKYSTTEFGNNKSHFNVKESLQVETGKRKLEISKQYSPYKSSLRDRSEEFDLNLNYRNHEEKESSRKDSRFSKEPCSKQVKLNNKAMADSFPVQKENTLGLKTDSDYKQKTPDICKVKSEAEEAVPSDKTNYSHEKRNKERKKKKKNKDEKERKKQKKDSKSEKHSGSRNQSERVSSGNILAFDNSEESINNKKYEEPLSKVNLNDLFSDKEGSSQNNITEEMSKRSDGNSQDKVQANSPLAAISKWEREDENMFSIDSKDFESQGECYEKVNIEVLRRAENALFSRNIGNKISLYHQKFQQSSTRPRAIERSNASTHGDFNRSKDLTKLHQFKEIGKNREELTGTLPKSIKSRLGVKITKKGAEPDYKNTNRYRSRSHSRDRHTFYDREDYFEPDFSTTSSFICKNKSNNCEPQESFNFDRERNKQTSDKSKEKRQRAVEFDKKKRKNFK